MTLNETGSNYTSDQVAERIAGFDGVMTGWGSPRITERVMQHADALRIISHSAGSVKRLVGEVVNQYIVPRQICVFSANEAIAYNVAEYTVGALIMTARRWVDFIAHTRSGNWNKDELDWNGRIYILPYLISSPMPSPKRRFRDYPALTLCTLHMG